MKVDNVYESLAEQEAYDESLHENERKGDGATATRRTSTCS